MLSTKTELKLRTIKVKFRPVFNSKNAPSFKLAKVFTSILKSYIPLPNLYNFQNSAQLVKEMSEIFFVPKLKLPLIDISNTYTNIPTDDLVNVIDTLCKKHDLEDALIRKILTVNKIIIIVNYFILGKWRIYKRMD